MKIAEDDYDNVLNETKKVEGRIRGEGECQNWLDATKANMLLKE